MIMETLNCTLKTEGGHSYGKTKVVVMGKHHKNTQDDAKKVYEP